MAIFTTNLEVILANENEIELYYETATKKINALLEKYDICDAKGNLEKLSADQFKALLSFSGFFQSTPLKSIFFNQKQQHVPQEIIQAFRSIISDPPLNIKAVFFNTFISLLKEKGWDKPLSAYFEKQYHLPPDGIIFLEEIKDFSLGVGVYRVTFQLRLSQREKIIVFLKRSNAINSFNELLYFQLQKKLLSTASYAKLPCRLSNKKNKEELLLSLLISGIAPDITLSIFTQAYRKTTNNYHKLNLKGALEVLIEAFIKHASLGDLLGRNDRHLMNSLLTFVVDGIPQNNALENLSNPEKILAYAKHIRTKKTNAISLIGIDLKWLLGEKNAAWALVDIDFGLSELNLLSLLPEFNDYNLKTNPYFEKRKEYVMRYFNIYCQKQEAILEQRELLFSAIKKFYPLAIAKRKLKILTQTINYFENSKDSVVKLFERYLLNFRMRLAHKATLFALVRFAQEANHANLLNALKKDNLLKYLPSQPNFISNEASVFLQLQCFRGVLSKKDVLILAENDRTSWETVASNILMIAKQFNSQLFKTLEDKKQFIEKDSTALLKAIMPSQSNSAGL